jgi:hypothetical protein
MSVGAICGCLTPEQRAELNKRATAVDEMLLAPKKREAVKKAIEHQNEPETDEGIPPFLARLSEKEAKAVASAINTNNNCTDQRVEPNGRGGLQMVYLDADGSSDGEPEKFELTDAADYSVDVEEIRRQVAAAANIRIINNSSEKMH